MRSALRPLARDRSGSAIVEFGILAPVICALLLGVLQVGLWMQNYNALRSAAVDTGRYVAVEYQKANKITNIQMALWARTHASTSYRLKLADLSTSVVDASTQSITGVTEKTLTFSYTMPSILGLEGIADIPVTFSRPIFVKST